MQTIINKAAVLIEALPYIQKFKGKKVVIKYGGAVISEKIYCESILRDVVFMRTVGMHPIIVHGGGKEISARIRNAGLSPRFVHGLRYTNEKTMEIVREVLRNVVSQHIADILKKFGADPVLLNGIDSGVLRCRTLREYMGQPIDLGLVGEITSIETETINQACDRGQVPVIAPIAVDEAGRLHNINADSIAGEICAGVHAEKMVYLSDIPGILRNTDDPESLLSSLKQSDVEPMIENGIIHGGMIPKIRACLKSLESGSKKTHVIDGRLQHSLLLEIFTDKGVGTEIVAG